jgi:hypothetical protein
MHLTRRTVTGQVQLSHLVVVYGCRCMLWAPRKHRRAAVSPTVDLRRVSKNMIKRSRRTTAPGRCIVQELACQSSQSQIDV